MDGYTKRAGECSPCTGAISGGSAMSGVAMLVVLFVVLPLVLYFLHYTEQGKWLTSHAVKSAVVKILVSFYTLIATMNLTFEINWPPAFEQVQAQCRVFMLDLTELAGVVCSLGTPSYFDTLYAATFTTFAFLLVVILYYQIRKRMLTTEKVKRRDIRYFCIKAMFYLFMFIYPLLSTRIIQAFVCRDVEGTLFLRADYSITCDTSGWYTAVTYAGVWTAVFVIGFPALTFWFLFTNRHSLNDEKFIRRGGFIYLDYKPEYYWWECLEVVELHLVNLLSCNYCPSILRC
jgi:hypothetical protein